MQLSLEGVDESFDFQYGYWNEFCEWVAEVRPEAHSILLKAPYSGGWKAGVGEDADEVWQDLGALSEDLKALSKDDEVDDHSLIVETLGALVEKATELGVVVEVA